MSEVQRDLTFAEAICDATRQALEADPTVYVMGEGVSDPKAIFETTRGLYKKFGPNRVIEMPIAENGLTGVAIGSALSGMRPLMVHQRVEFALYAFEQIVNSAAKMLYSTAGKASAPLTIRLIIGRGWGQGPCHAQSLESVFGHFPGLRVVMPTTPHDAKGMLLSAIRCDDPVIFLEHRWLHSTHGPVPEEAYYVPLDKPKIVKHGSDITMVASSLMSLEALAVQQALAVAGVSAALIDLRSIRPLNIDEISKSVKATGRLLHIDSGWSNFGVGSEVISRLVERDLGIFKVRPRRLGMADYPSPATRALARDYYPFPEDILEAALAMLGLPEDRENVARAALSESQAEREDDRPHKDFLGPF